jgi:hypothetical protein
MNKLILLTVILIFAVRLDAQSIKERDVPSAVAATVKATYPDVSKVKWEMEDGMYEASFSINKMETSLVLSKDGTLVMTEEEIAVAALPALVTAYIGKHNPSAVIKEATKMTDTFGVVTYEVGVGETDYLFDSKGTFLRQEQEDDDDADDDKK